MMQRSSLSLRSWKRRLALVFCAGLGIATQPGIAWSHTADADIYSRLAAEQAETQRLMRDLLIAKPTAETVSSITEAAPEKALQALEDGRALWRSGKRPPNFDEFVRIVTEGRADLYPRQRQAFVESKLITPEQLLNPSLRSVRELVLVWGKGSGKDWVCAMLSAWAFLVLCSLVPDPAIYFAEQGWIKNLGPYSRLSIINVATSEKQAVSVYFKQYFLQFLGHPIFTEIIQETNWGDQAKAPPSEQLVHYRRNPITRARYESVGVYPMHSRAAGVEGHNCFMWLMDEADALFDATGKSVAEALHSLFRSSAGSRFLNWTGFVISYPRLKGGFMLRLKEFGDKMIAARPNAPRWYTDVATTQEVNPNFKLDDPEVQEDFEKNPHVARAMYFCQPLETEQAFLEFPELFDRCIDPKRQPIARVGIEHLDLPVRGDAEGRANYYLRVTLGNILRVPGHRYVVTGDAGRNHDSFVMNVWHWDGQSEAFGWLCPECGADKELRSMGAYHQCHRGERRGLNVEVECGACARTPAEIVGNGGAAAAYSGGLAGFGSVLVAGWWERESREDNSTIMVGGRPLRVAHLSQDLIVRVVPRRATHYNPENEMGRNRVVFFPATGEAALQICHALEPEAARFDPWQAVDIIDRLRSDWGGDVEQFKMTAPEQLRMYTWSRKMIEGNFVTFLDDPVQTREWKRLQLVNGGNKVDHPKGDGESNDIAFCGAGAIWTCSTRIDSQLSVSWI